METFLATLKLELSGEIFWDQKMRLLYATDASAYRELPLAVAFPKNEQDLKLLIAFANQHNTSLIPRTAGTSLAGQVVGAGIVVDVSKYFTQIIELNADEKWVRVQPGVVRDELNSFLKLHNLFFGPETSTANRAMIGGMVGNNSCGSNSLIYQSTREHTISIKALLADGSDVEFKELSFEEFTGKCHKNDLEGRLYKQIRSILGNYENQQQIIADFPKSSIPRRNTGYAIDLLLQSNPFTQVDNNFNFCQLICGSEGTLAFITEIKLNLVPLPNQMTGLLCVHFTSVEEALKANLIALKFGPLVSELMDKYILDCTENNIEQTKNRFFVKGNPAAILIVEYGADSAEKLVKKVEEVENAMRHAELGYYFPLITGSDKKKVWDLRKAGLGLLSNMPGDEKPVAVIEDTAVDVQDLPAYIQEFNELLSRYNLYAVHYAHAATGELHLRPIINLKTEKGNLLFREIAFEVAKLVKKYRGSLSGEHGDGRLRGEFIALMVGDHNYQLLKEIKQAWDPKGIFNPGKIVFTPAMNSSLRYDYKHVAKSITSYFRYDNQSILQHTEQCNGSADCRKSHLAGGTMCPSYMVTKNEQDTTRARANILREMLTQSNKANPYDHDEIKEVMDLCISCKGCKSECPSSVDMAKLKADFLQHYYDANGTPIRARMIGHVDQLASIMSNIPSIYNWTISNSLTGKLIKKLIGFSQYRALPTIASQSLRAWFRKRKKSVTSHTKVKSVYFFCDEFTNYNDVEIGKKAILLLESLHYEVLMIPHEFSGRALLSKGLLRDAKKLANRNVKIFSSLLNEENLLVGVEPSTILTFRDEYVDLVDEQLAPQAKAISTYAVTIEEFLAKELALGNISASQFTDDEQLLMVHGHCQQKAWGLEASISEALSIPMNYKTQKIPSGCCGMAGSFGYEKEHYDLSMQIGELVLFPAIRTKTEDSIVVAPGTSCRHQIEHGTHQKAKHPVEVLYAALKNK